MRFKSIMLWTFLLVVTLATASDTQDPFVIRSKNLQISYHNALEIADPLYEDHGRKTVLGTLDGVRYLPIPLTNAKYVAFLAEMKKFKTDLEAESMNRANQPLGSNGLNALTQVSAEYLDLQAKLYANYAKMVQQYHPEGASHFSFSELDQLNLIVNKKVGLPFMTNEKMKRQFNVRHKSQAMVELFVTEEDKHAAEYISLVSPKDSLGYAKLIQFATIRETMVNRWALRRLQALPSADPAVNSCGTELLSFKFLDKNSVRPLHDTPAYTQLGALDSYNDFQKLADGLQAASVGKPISDSDFYLSMVRKVFGAFPQFVNEIVPVIAPAKITSILEEVVPNLVKIEESSWDLAAKEVILDSSFPADDFSADAVSDRIATAAFDMHKVFLIQTLMQGLQDKGIRAAQGEKSAEYLNAFKKVSQVVTTETAPLRDSWILAQKTAFKKVLSNQDSGWNRLLIADERLNQVVNGIENHAKQAFRADHLHREIVISQRTKIGRGDGPTGYKSAADYLKSNARTSLSYTMAPFTPELLKKYFYKKLEEFSAMKEDSGEYAVAHQISGSRVIMMAVENFFSKLDTDFQAAVQQAQITEVTPENSPMGPLLKTAGFSAYNDLKQLISTPDKSADAPAATTNPFFTIKPLATDAISSGRLNTPIQDLNPSNYISSEPARVQVEGKFLNALNTMGVNLLNSKPFNLDLLAPTVRDQNMLAVVLSSEALVKAPLLRIESKERDGKYFTMDDKNAPLSKNEQLAWMGGLMVDRPEDNYALAHLAPAYDLKTDRLDHAKAILILQKVIDVAVRNNQGKLEDFCAANPRDPDHDVKFKDLFRSASALREVFTQNPNVAKLDADMKLATRTQNQKILEDYINPIGTVAMLVILCIICVQFGPIIWGAIVSNAAIAGAGSSVASGIIAQIFIGNFGPVTAMFFVQTLMMVNVNFFQLPPQLAYQLQVANSQIGMGSKLTMTRENLTKQRDELTSAQYWTWFAIAGDALQLGFTVQEARHGLGIIGAKALKNLSEAPVKGWGSETSFADLVREKGVVNSVVALTPKVQHVTAPILESLLDSKLGKVLGDDPESLENAYKMALDLDRAKLTKLQNLSEVLQAEVERTRALTSGTMPTLDDLFKSYVSRVKMLVPPRGGFKLWVAAFWKNGYRAVQAGKLPLYWEKMPELALFVKAGQIQEITASITYFEEMSTKLAESRKLFADGLQGDASKMKVLEFHFSRLSDQDLMMHQKLFKQMEKAAPSATWTSALDAFKNFDTVKADIRNIDSGIALEKEFEQDHVADVIVAEDGSITTGAKIPDSQMDEYETQIIDPDKLVHP